MTVVEPTLPHDGATIKVFGNNQPPYDALPASVDNDGLVMTEWEPSAEDLALLMRGGRVRVWLHHTGVQLGQPLTPIAVEICE